ncbi:MAG: ABC transporter substrate-binding protein [Archaeoglobales archaeon]|nr:MAG: ABC transporter substrate-binding protein [Archaeoglobales archaeon]
MRKNLFALLLLAIALALVGCAQEKPEIQQTPQAGITITDMAGRTITLNETPERVVVLTSYWAETLRLLGASDKVVGVGNYVPKSDYISESIKNKPTVGSVFKGVNWEAVASLNPDLVITDWYGGKYKDKEIIEKAEQLGIPVIALQAKTIEDNAKCIEILGKAFGKEDKAKKIVDFMNSKLNEVKGISEQVPEKKVLVISAPKDISGPITVYAKGSAWGSIPEIVGAHNVAFDKEFDTQWPKLDLEKIIAWWNDADVLIVISFDDSKLEEAVKKIKEDERWREVKAVREGHVYGILAGGKFGHFLDWGPRIVVGVYQFGCAIYPKDYPRWQKVADELLSFYDVSFYRTVIDTEGRDVKVPLKVERAVVLAGQVAELMYCWGNFDKVVGITRWAEKNPVLAKFTNLEEVPVVGSGRDPNVEAIISLKPDIVITYGGEYGYSTPKSVIEQLEKAEIPVVLVELSNLDEVYRTIEIVGEILDKKDKASETIDQMKEVIALVRDEAGKIPEEKRIKAIWLWSKQTKVTGNAGVTNDLIVNAGAINPASELEGKYVDVQLEKIVAWNPDVIIIWSSAKYQPEDLISDPRWQDISAIKNKRVYKQPRLLADTWSIRVAVLQAWMFDKFYPGRMDFNSIANEFFEHLYGITYEEFEKELEG